MKCMCIAVYQMTFARSLLCPRDAPCVSLKSVLPRLFFHARCWLSLDLVVSDLLLQLLWCSSLTLTSCKNNMAHSVGFKSSMFPPPVARASNAEGTGLRARGGCTCMGSALRSSRPGWPSAYNRAVHTTSQLYTLYRSCDLPYISSILDTHSKSHTDLTP